MYLTRVFLKRPTLVFVLIALTTLAAIMALRSLVVQQTPNSGLPSISVSVGYPGASTTELVTEIAQPIEDQLAGTPFLDHIDTTIQTGQVNISASFATQSTDTENIANVEKAIQAAARSLPSTIAAPSIRVADPSEPTVIALALVSSKYPEAVLASIANNSIVPAIEQLPGISNVNVTGTTQPAFVVTVDPNMLAADNLTLTDVVGSITPNNVRAPGGIVYGSGHETQLDVRGDLPNPQAVANLPIHVAYAGTTVAGATTGGASGVSATGGSSASGTAAGAPGSATIARGTAPRANATVPPARINAPVQILRSGASLATMPPLPSGATTGSFATSGGTSTGSSAATGTSTAGTSTTGTTTSTGGTSTGGTSTGGTSTGGTTASTGGTSTGGTSGTAASGGYSTATSTATTTSATTTSTSNIVSSENPTANVPVDPPLTPSTITSTSASTGTSTAGALPSTGSSSYGSGAGTSTSGFVGALQSWAVPSADKRISDVATVLNGTVVQRVFSSQNGKPGVTLLVQKATQASEVTVADEVVKALPALKAQFPNVDFQIAHVQATYTEQQVEGVEHTLIEGIALTAIVMLFFLGSWRNAVVVMIAIPTSLGVTLFVMQMLSLTLDTISLMAMTLVIGILIDDSTVVLENIERHHAMGEEPADAALNGRSEIGMAAIVLTTVDVIVFLPIAFAGGQVGQLLTEFAIVVTVATVTSLFVSFTITPALAGLWSMKSTWRPWRPIRWFNGRFDALRTRYAQRWLPAAMRRPWPIVIVAVVTCAIAFLLVPTGLVGEEFIPPQNQGIITVQVTYLAGYPVAQTNAAMSRLEAIVKQAIPEKALQYETTVAGAYSAAFGGFVQEGNVGQITVYLNNPQQTTRYTNLLQQKLPGAASGAHVAVTASTGLGGGAQQPMDELVSTTDGSDPTASAQKVSKRCRTRPVRSVRRTARQTRRRRWKSSSTGRACRRST